jgi:hypothetical protein
MKTIRDLILFCLLISSSGCASFDHTNPLPGWGSNGSFLVPAELPPFPAHKAITDDYQNYVRSKGIRPDEIRFFENKDGCHAVSVEQCAVGTSIFGSRKDADYVLIYDKNDARKKAKTHEWSVLSY